MKKRLGFVSNSSSSSFICVICGGIEGGFDCGLEEVEMLECAAGHEFHEDCMLKEDLEKIDFEEEDSRYGVDISLCPICSMKQLLEEDGYAFLKIKNGISEKEVVAEVNEKFDTYKDFKEYLKEKKS